MSERRAIETDSEARAFIPTRLSETSFAATGRERFYNHQREPRPFHIGVTILIWRERRALDGGTPVSTPADAQSTFSLRRPTDQHVVSLRSRLHISRFPIYKQGWTTATITTLKNHNGSIAPLGTFEVYRKHSEFETPNKNFSSIEMTSGYLRNEDMTEDLRIFKDDRTRLALTSSEIVVDLPVRILNKGESRAETMVEAQYGVYSGWTVVMTTRHGVGLCEVPVTRRAREKE
ncbi:hypothetical protein LSTR_LSTR009343 [Laodelphax striatellus]|uniref:Uncharacterized protein n=1 Tax=Laodelphax striatellus TaxID=195883 RepID=A0A482XI80_LAOST|nr:hypothetical protein LSTR_LSTR009343 [Laodelphax striatellus]